jgi:Cytidylyltransferase-like
MATTAFDRFLSGELEWFLQTPEGEFGFAPPPSGILFAGSFNPLHHGHTALADLASNRLGRSCAFELSVQHAEKPALSVDELLQRLAQFHGVGPVYVTRAPEFRKKAALFPNSVFVLGADTAARVVQPKFYGGDPANMLAALEEIRALGCRFLVGGRADPDGNFVEVDGVAIPEGCRDLFEGVDEGEFRVDVSSTELREHIK